MLSLFSGTARDCEGVHRRSFLQIGALSGLGLSLPMWLAGRQAVGASPSSRDVNCILILSQGGVSHHDTLDPKPNAPVSVRGEFQAIDTAVPGVKFTDICPTLAKELGRYALLRGWNPKNGSHGTADQPPAATSERSAPRANSCTTSSKARVASKGVQGSRCAGMGAG